MPVPILRSAPDSAFWQRQVEELEWFGGPYSPQLTETLSGQAAYLQEQGDHAAAIRSLRRAVHVTRINEGLQSELQIPLVRRLVENYLVNGDLQMADDLQDYLFFLYRENHTETSLQRIDASVDFLDWQRQAWLAELGEKRDRRLFNALQLVEDLLDDSLLEQELPLDSLRKLVATRMRLYYLLEQGQFGVEDVFSASLNQGFGNDPEAQISMEERRLQTLQRNAYARGRNDLKRLLTQQELAGEKLAGAATRIALGDWHLWHDRVQRATLEYKDAWTDLSEPALLPWRQQWLEQPLELPAGDVYFAPIALHNSQVERIPVEVQFMVSDRGRAKEIQVQILAEGRDGYSGQLKRWLRAARFRPAMAEQELLDDVVIERRYTIIY